MADLEMNVSDVEIHMYESFTNVPEAERCNLAKYNR